MSGPMVLSRSGPGRPLPQMLVACHGDSITNGAGVPTQDAFPAALSRLLYSNNSAVADVRGFGINGQGFYEVYLPAVNPRTLIEDQAVQINPLLALSYPVKYLVIFAGTNDHRLAGKTAAQVWAGQETYVQDAIAAGWAANHIRVCTMLDREGGFGAFLDDVNAYYVAGATTYGYTAVRLDLNAHIGGHGAQSNGTYFLDQIHPTAAGHIEIATEIVATIP